MEMRKDLPVRPEIQVLRAACDSLIVLDGLNLAEQEALASITRDLRKMIPNPDDDTSAANQII
jgi:hypothetical protein